MFKLLRLFFTLGGIGLFFGAFVTDDWTSLSERFACGFAGFMIFAICQPSATFRFLKWLWNSLSSIFTALWNIAYRKDISVPDAGETNDRQYVDFDGSPHYEYTPPTPISRGNISILSGDEMVTIMRNYQVVDEIRTKVKGVTFRNDDGTDRQSILAHCHAGDQLRFEPFEYEGSPAYAVHCEWGQIGNLSADLAEELAEMIAARKNKCLILGEILNVSGGYQGEYFGCNISLTIYEKRY